MRGQSCKMWNLTIGAWLFVLVLLLPSLSYAQVRVQARLDTHTIRIGEQPVLTLSLTYHRKKDGKPSISFPKIGDTINDAIETIQRSPVDTLLPKQEKGPDIRRLIQRIRITSFDTGRHRIPPFHFRSEGDTIRTEPLILEVLTVDVGKSKEPRPIKGIHEFPYTWSAWFRDHWPWFVAAGGALLLGWIIFLYYRYRKKKAGDLPEPLPRPPDEVAMERLEELKEHKAWQEWDPKDYYTELTDVLRHYLEERYRIPALEETTPRILKELSYTDIDEEGKSRVRKLLRKADMVKFAKERPEIGERESSLHDSIAFVERSTPKKEEENPEEG